MGSRRKSECSSNCRAMSAAQQQCLAVVTLNDDENGCRPSTFSRHAGCASGFRLPLAAPRKRRPVHWLADRVPSASWGRQSRHECSPPRPSALRRDPDQTQCRRVAARRIAAHATGIRISPRPPHDRCRAARRPRTACPDRGYESIRRRPRIHSGPCRKRVTARCRDPSATRRHRRRTAP